MRKDWPLLRRIMPRSLFGRALLIIIVPTVLVQLVSTYIFYERHWDTVQRYMAESLAGEVAFLADEMDDIGYNRRRLIAYNAHRHMSLTLRFLDGDEASLLETGERPEEWMRPLTEALTDKLSVPFRLTFDKRLQQVIIRIALPSGVMEVAASRKRISSPTTYIYVMWMTGAAVLFLFVSILFLRNQIRPIIRLARAAHQFGKGIDVPYFRPSGAQEVRKAAQAFWLMQERISRLMQKRAEMLAAVSHDLRTPITRMKLELALLKDGEMAESLRADLEAMESMIEEYLDFVRGAGTEVAEPQDVDMLLRDTVADYQRHQRPVSLRGQASATMPLRRLSMQRCLANIIDNGLRYASRVEVTATRQEEAVLIHIDDDGPGIPEADRARALTAFQRLDTSRNPQTGGVGLGLAIAKDITLSHGGTLTLHDSPLGGLRVEIRLEL